MNKPRIVPTVYDATTYIFIAQKEGNNIYKFIEYNKETKKENRRGLNGHTYSQYRTASPEELELFYKAYPEERISLEELFTNQEIL